MLAELAQAGASPLPPLGLLLPTWQHACAATEQLPCLQSAPLFLQVQLSVNDPKAPNNHME